MPGQFRVGVTRDFLGPDGRIAFGDIGLSPPRPASGPVVGVPRRGLLASCDPTRFAATMPCWSWGLA